VIRPPRGMRPSLEDMHFLESVATILATAIARRQTEQRLYYLAQFDPLTGLPNRNLFHDRLAQAIARSKREGDVAALILLDLDRFKEINDALGHSAGDRVLVEVARRLTACLREGDTVARFGGDEFVIVLESLPTPGHAEAAIEKVMAVFGEPVRVEDVDLFVTPSLGISFYPRDGGESHTLLKHADTAMYVAKNEGRNGFRYYVPRLGTAARNRMSMESSLRKAMEHGELRLHYQPVVNLRTGHMEAVEALLRWEHPEWGFTPPSRFIAVAEQTGLIVPMGEWVLEESLRQLAELHRQGLPGLRMAVNLSARQLRQSRLAECLQSLLAATKVSAECVELEITESLLVENPLESGQLLGRLKDMGARIALDDFGTGYSSLSYLKHFPIDTVKIDRSFVGGVSEVAGDATMVKAILNMAQGLKLSVTAEGVEHQRQLDFLRDNGCERGQGFLLGHPMTAELLLRRESAVTPVA
jgi:diguanylate cyclase (GGDEF)-like protein